MRTSRLPIWTSSLPPGDAALLIDPLRRGSYTIDVLVGAAHRLGNLGEEKLVFIETQRGSYPGEDDIGRLHDDFGRATEGSPPDIRC